MWRSGGPLPWLAALAASLLQPPSARAGEAPWKRAPATPAAVGRAGGAAAVCAGDYADEITALKASVREYERDPATKYSYCLRTTAVYECLSYASDGSIRRTRKTTVAHGTGFAYRRSGGDTYLLTNEHVASWPAVSDENHVVEDVPAGCKLVSETVKVVDNEGDDYEGNDVLLGRVASDPALDVAVLKTRAPLKVIPYAVGRSAALHVGNAVIVHGYPLGAFAATNLGKVVNAYDHDTDKDWDHVDFVVDALLSPGNSGSPVLAVSCRTGEYELVGIYHAGYVRGSALNVVIGIDQVKELMTTLKRTSRVSDANTRGAVGAGDRTALAAALSAAGPSSFFPFPFGPLVAAARLRAGGALAFEVYSKGFPLQDDRLLIVEDLPPGSDDAAGAFGRAGRTYLGNVRGLRPIDRAALDADAQAQLDRILARLRAGAANAARYRGTDQATSKGHKKRRSIEQALARQAESDRDAAQALFDLSERLGPKPDDRITAYRDVLPPTDGTPPPAAAVAAPTRRR